MTDIDALIAAMTIEEKAGQLNMLAWGAPLTGAIAAGDATGAVRDGKVGSLINLVGAADVAEVQRVAVEETRHKIPLFFGYDVIHGHRTLYPVPIGEAGAFDPDLWERTARSAAVEASADGQDIAFSPMVDVSRDPRWGRTVEGAGEDPWLAARFGEAKVRGYQAPGLRATDALSGCAKHFCAYGKVQAGREYAPSDVSPRAVREVYLPPFEAAVKAGVAAIMPSLNALDGVPMTANKPLLQGWLRDRLGFDGLVISDYGAVRELVNHGTAADVAAAAALCIQAGCDVDMMGYAYVDHLPEAVKRGLCTVAEVDVCVRRVLRFKERLGLFADPYRRCRLGEPPLARTLSREAAVKSIVLLKNEGGLLPLAGGRRRIAVLGPLADAPRQMNGSWAAKGNPFASVGVLAGLRTAFPEADLDTREGVAIEGGGIDGIAAAVEAARGADVVVLCVGEGVSLNGEATSRTDLDLPGHQRALAEAVLDAGRPVVAVVFCGRPPIVPWLADRAQALVCAWLLGSEAGHAVADVLCGAQPPSGRLAMTWPRSMGQVPIFFGSGPNGRPFDPTDHYTSKYLDCPNEPLFPFGHGLATTTFSLSDLRADGDVLAEGQPLRVTIAVANTGPRAGEATLFLFLRDPVARVVRPRLELRGVAKAMLRPGESRDLGFDLVAADAAYPRDGYDAVLEPGALDILVGQSAAPGALSTIRVRVGAATS